jgi:hypothetical protein
MLFAVASPGASASTVAVSSGSAVFTAAPGFANDVTVANGASSYVFSDPAASVTAGAGCSQTTGNSVTCPTSGVSTLRVNLDDGNDRLTVTASQNVIADGGVGNDELNGGAQGDQLTGGDGDDTLVGGLGPDLMDGGVGYDKVSYATRVNAVRVDLDGSWDDGEAPTTMTPELDNVSPTVEEVTGGAGADTFVGTAGANVFNGGDGADTIDGLGGDDTLQGQGGNDLIDGGYGTDTIDGGADDDGLMSRDSGLLDHVVCGSGNDSLTADREDDVAAGCETVDVPAAPTAPPSDPPASNPPTSDPPKTDTPKTDPPASDPKPDGKAPNIVTIVERILTISPKGAIPVKIACGVEQTRDCRGTISITASLPKRKPSASRRSGPAKGGHVVVAKGKFKVKRGRTALASVKASPKALKKAFGPKVKRVNGTLTVSMRNSDGSTTQILKPISISARKRS